MHADRPLSLKLRGLVPACAGMFLAQPTPIPGFAPCPATPKQAHLLVACSYAGLPVRLAQGSTGRGLSRAPCALDVPPLKRMGRCGRWAWLGAQRHEWGSQQLRRGCCDRDLRCCCCCCCWVCCCCCGECIRWCCRGWLRCVLLLRLLSNRAPVHQPEQLLFRHALQHSVGHRSGAIAAGR